METTLPIDYPLDECGLPTEAPNMFIFSLQGEFSLQVWDCKGKCYIENYTMVSGVNFHGVDTREIVETEHASH